MTKRVSFKIYATINGKVLYNKKKLMKLQFFAEKETGLPHEAREINEG